MPTAKCPVSGRRLPYLYVHYGLSYGRTYLPFSPLPTACPAARATRALVKPPYCCWTAKRTIVYLFTQFSNKLAMRETFHDCKHGELE